MLSESEMLDDTRINDTRREITTAAGPSLAVQLGGAGGTMAGGSGTMVTGSSGAALRTGSRFPVGGSNASGVGGTAAGRPVSGSTPTYSWFHRRPTIWHLLASSSGGAVEFEPDGTSSGQVLIYRPVEIILAVRRGNFIVCWEPNTLQPLLPARQGGLTDAGGVRQSPIIFGG
jgi:hypothetical protein